MPPPGSTLLGGLPTSSPPPTLPFLADSAVTLNSHITVDGGSLQSVRLVSNRRSTYTFLQTTVLHVYTHSMTVLAYILNPSLSFCVLSHIFIIYNIKEPLQKSKHTVKDIQLSVLQMCDISTIPQGLLIHFQKT